MSNKAKEISINNFNANKTPSNLQKCINAGLEAKVLENNNWAKFHTWKDGFNEYHDVIPLYDKINGIFSIIGIGFYKKLDR